MILTEYKANIYRAARLAGCVVHGRHLRDRGATHAPLAARPPEFVVAAAATANSPNADSKRGDEARLPARVLNVLCRFGAGSFELTLWSTLVTTRRVAGIAG